MEQHRIEAYRFIESKVLLDIRQFSAGHLLPKSFFHFLSYKNRRTVAYIAKLNFPQKRKKAARFLLSPGGSRYHRSGKP